MAVGALICEYNPFHNGHKYMLDMMRRDGCDCIVAVMSGSFTQRGDVAVYSKFSRIKQALSGGADLVIELPSVWAVSSAQRFAKGGCDIIKGLGCVDRLYFGSECGDISKLRAVAEATLDEKVNLMVKNFMDKGDYYPVALQKAIEYIYSKEYADILSSPNNTLGLEYIKALKNSGIGARTIKRTGVDHDSENTTDNIASASKIRELILKSEDFTSYVPESITQNNPAFLNFGERALLLKLRELTAQDLEAIPDVTEGLHNRISSASKDNNTIEEILSEIKTKRYTHSRLRRILICALLGIKKEHLKKDVPYIRVLGFSQKGAELLKKASSTTTLPLIINVAKDMQSLDEVGKEILQIDIKGTDIRTIFEKSPS
ncbi:MAG: nucleotidyltransferase family protein, partial [Ruminococcus sp.]|nr:nucleotidyltransferase family protein [Ruminococcus sp.]